MEFKLDESQVERYEAWRKKIEKKNPMYFGAAGGGYSFIFDKNQKLIKIIRDDGKELLFYHQ
jgi:hypothetical protein